MKNVFYVTLLFLLHTVFFMDCRHTELSPLVRMSTVSNCRYCKEINAPQKERYCVLYHSPRVIAQLQPQPNNPHAIVIYPTRHTTYFHELHERTIIEMNQVLNKITYNLQHYFKTDSFTVCMQLGPSTNSTFNKHLHITLIPSVCDKKGNRIPQKTKPLLKKLQIRKK